MTGSLQVEETSAYCTVNLRASASNYQLSNMKRPARDSNLRPQRLEERTLTATPLNPLSESLETTRYCVTTILLLTLVAISELFVFRKVTPFLALLILPVLSSLWPLGSYFCLCFVFTTRALTPVVL